MKISQGIIFFCIIIGVVIAMYENNFFAVAGWIAAGLYNIVANIDAWL